MHKVIVVDQWTPLGAFVRCTQCGCEYHETHVHFGTYYLGFEHTSMRGPEQDAWVFVLAEEVKNGAGD